MDEKLQIREHSMNVPRIPFPHGARAKAARFIAGPSLSIFFPAYSFLFPSRISLAKFIIL